MCIVMSALVGLQIAVSLTHPLHLHCTRQSPAPLQTPIYTVGINGIGCSFLSQTELYSAEARFSLNCFVRIYQDMILLDYNPEVECWNELIQAGHAVNSTGCFGQTPAHLAAFGGQAYCLLWFLHAGADVNQQDDLGEAAIHKAAKTGSLQCISLLVASAARIELCNCAGQTAEDLALSHGHADCVNFLAKIRETQSKQPQLHNGQLPADSSDRGGNLVHRPSGYKRMCGVFEADKKKKARIDGIQQSNKELCKGGRTEHLLSPQEVRSV